jgi:hypothetical protein
MLVCLLWELREVGGGKGWGCEGGGGGPGMRWRYFFWLNPSPLTPAHGPIGGENQLDFYRLPPPPPPSSGHPSPEMEFMKVQFRTRFLGIILRFLKLDVSTFVFAFLQDAIHEQTWVFFADRLFCRDIWNHRGGVVFYHVFLLSMQPSPWPLSAVADTEVFSPRKP